MDKINKKKHLVAIQMDPLNDINIKTDSTFLVALELQGRGYELFFYEPKNLSIKNNHAIASGVKANLNKISDNYYQIIQHIDQFELSCAELILVRQDPPFDMNYITSTYILDLIKDNTLIINNTSGIRNFSEKFTPLFFPEFTPEAIVSSQIEELKKFAKEHGCIVLKPLYDGGGRGIIKVDFKDSNFSEKISLYVEKFGYVMAQRFLEEISNGDKRVILVDGQVIGAFRRKAKEGDFRVNTASGGSFEACELSEHDLKICDKISPLLKENGLFLVGIDIVGKYLIEVNNTSPTGLAAINLIYGANIEKKVVNLIESKMVNWYKGAK